MSYQFLEKSVIVFLKPFVFNYFYRLHDESVKADPSKATEYFKNYLRKIDLWTPIEIERFVAINQCQKLCSPSLIQSFIVSICVNTFDIIPEDQQIRFDYNKFIHHIFGMTAQLLDLQSKAFQDSSNLIPVYQVIEQAITITLYKLVPYDTITSKLIILPTIPTPQTFNKIGKILTNNLEQVNQNILKLQQEKEIIETSPLTTNAPVPKQNDDVEHFVSNLAEKLLEKQNKYQDQKSPQQRYDIKQRQQPYFEEARQREEVRREEAQREEARQREEVRREEVRREEAQREEARRREEAQREEARRREEAQQREEVRQPYMTGPYDAKVVDRVAPPQNVDPYRQYGVDKEENRNPRIQNAFDTKLKYNPIMGFQDDDVPTLADPVNIFNTRDGLQIHEQYGGGK